MFVGFRLNPVSCIMQEYFVQIRLLSYGYEKWCVYMPSWHGNIHSISYYIPILYHILIIHNYILYIVVVYIIYHINIILYDSISSWNLTFDTHHCCFFFLVWNATPSSKEFGLHRQMCHLRPRCADLPPPWLLRNSKGPGSDDRSRGPRCRKVGKPLRQFFRFWSE